MGNICEKICSEQETVPKRMNSFEDNVHYNQQVAAREEFLETDSPAKRHKYFGMSIEYEDLPTRSGELITNIYDIDQKMLGEGTFGSVFIGKRKSDLKGQEFAIKKIMKQNRSDQDESQQVMREIELMKVLDHPNILRFYEVYEESAAYYMVLEYCKGGDLYDKLEKEQFLFEKEARDYIWQVLLAVNYLHKRRVIHMDLKPENFMFLEAGKKDLKVIDFGLAKSIKGKDKITSVPCGTPYYIAPEVINETFDEKCDLWSIGVILYEIMTGEHPFDGDSPEEIFESVKSGEYDLEKFTKNKVSPECIEILKLFLTIDPELRISSFEALNHPWFQENVKKTKEFKHELMTPKMLQNLKSFSLSSLIQKEMSYLMVQAFNNDDEINKIKKIFLSIDNDYSGTIQKEEIWQLFKDMDSEISMEQAEQVTEKIYFRDQGMVTFLEFEAALLDKSFFCDPERLRMLYVFMDDDNSGFIDPHDFFKIYRRFGLKLDKKKVERMVKESDFDCNGKIDFGELTRIMNNEVAVHNFLKDIEKKKEKQKF